MSPPTQAASSLVSPPASTIYKIGNSADNSRPTFVEKTAKPQVSTTLAGGRFPNRVSQVRILRGHRTRFAAFSYVARVFGHLAR
jgi:hypothetical protein